MKRILVGITGKSCSGKNYVASILQERGWVVVDADEVAHRVLNTLSDRVSELFGPQVIKADGTVDRKALGQIVFSDPDRLRELEGLIHPAVKQHILQVRKLSDAPVVAINGAVLHRSGIDRLCSAVIFVRSPYRLRVKRARKRDGVTESRFRLRTRNQGDVNPRTGLKGVRVYVLDNRGNSSKIHRQIDRICDSIY